MSYCECAIVPASVLLPGTLIFLYLGAVVVSIVNTAEYFQKRKDVYASALIAAHLAFTVAGTVAFFCVSAVLWLWSAKYSFTHAERMWRLCVGLWFVFFLKDLPLLIIETHAYLQVGWRGGNLMDASFVLQIVFFVPASLATSATIAWYAAGFLERQFGDAFSGKELAMEKRPRRVEPEIAAQLAAATAAPAVVHPTLPLHEMRYSTAGPPRLYPASTSYEAKTVGEMSHEPLTAPQSPPPPLPTYVVADYNDNFVLNQGGVHVRLPMNDLRGQGKEESAPDYPSVI